MSQEPSNTFRNHKPYVPATLSEIYDMLASMLGDAPTFIDKLGHFPRQNIETEFARLNESFGNVRKKLGEERYAALLDLSARAKTLFAEDQDETNGKYEQGLDLLIEIEDIVQAARRRRVKGQLPDDEGKVTGD